MRVALYNQMFGLNGRSFWKNIIGHWAVHYQRDPERIWRRADISKTIDIIQKSKAEIIGIVEVLEGQEKELKKGLREKGYNFFYLGKGHKTKYSELYVQELVASKIKGEQKDTEEWPVEHRLGGGGGFVHVYYPRQQFHLLLAHLGLRSRKYHLKQIDFLQNYTRKLEGRVILLGDFNLSYQSLKPHFLGFDLVSEEIKTCSTTPIMNLFYNKDVDHILVRGFNKEKVGSLEGRSDHKLIYADLK